MSSNERGNPKGEKRILAPVVAALLVFTAGPMQPAPRAQAPTERWVGSWSTALVGRPQTPPLPGPPGPAPFMRNACPAPAAPATPPAVPPARRHVRASAVRTLHEPDAAADRPHQRGRIATACGAEQYVRERAAHDRRRPHRASRERRRRSSGAGPSSDVQRQKQHHDSGQRDRLQRSRRTVGAAVVRSCRRCVSARHNEYAGTARDARFGVPDVLHL